jgi:uncharacterized protein (TIGR03118 family)
MQDGLCLPGLLKIESLQVPCTWFAILFFHAKVPVIRTFRSSKCQKIKKTKKLSNMNKRMKSASLFESLRNAPLLITSITLFIGCNKATVKEKDLRDFSQVNLIANSQEYHPVTIDTTLRNAFGIAWTPNGVAWVNSVGGHVSELYNAEGEILRSPVNIPSPKDTIGGLPCGIVLATGKGFNLSSGPANFLFTGFDGVLSGWNGASGNNAKRLKSPPNASFTGLAIASNSGRNFIYAANFGEKRIDVWDTTFTRVNMDFKDPTLPDSYSPYNIQAIGDWLFVMYAELATTGPGAGHGLPGAGKGFVSVFDTDGNFIKRFASRGSLNIPWGITLAPRSFLEERDLANEGGEDHFINSNTKNPEENASENKQKKQDPDDPVVLIGNFGDGRINVFAQDGNFLGQLHDHKNTIVIDGLWSLSFAPSTAIDVDPSRLYFTAGPDKETDGIFGYLKKK